MVDPSLFKGIDVVLGLFAGDQVCFLKLGALVNHRQDWKLVVPVLQPKDISLNGLVEIQDSFGGCRRNLVGLSIPKANTT